jgi:hypothetical protein
LTHIAQVGGNHYAAEYQHWDWVEDLEMGYLEGNATKYLVRWRAKDGLKDLRKAHSYIMKLLVRHQEHGRKNACKWKWSACAHFFAANNVGREESVICGLIASWDIAQDLYNILEVINEMIAVNFPETRQSRVTTGIDEWTVPAPAHWDHMAETDNDGPVSPLAHIGVDE